MAKRIKKKIERTYKLKITSRQKSLYLVNILKERKALKPVVLDMRDVGHFYDYFVICSVESERQAKAVFDAVLHSAKKDKIFVHHVEEDKTYRWLLIDFSDVVLHIFDKEARDFYGLERIWKEARKIRLSS